MTPGLWAALWAVPEAAARVGGGEGFGGGGGDGGGGGGGGGGGVELELVRLVVWLVFNHPTIGLPILVIGVVLWASSRQRPAGRATARRRGPHRPRPPARAQPVDLGPLRALDPLLSGPLVVDLAGLVYSRTWRSRAEGDLAPARPYLAPALAEELERAPRPALEGVLLGATRLVAARRVGQRGELTVEIEANLLPPQGPGEYLRERWMFARDLSAPSPDPRHLRALTCPCCGDPASAEVSGRCRSCGNLVNDGRVQWRVEGMQALERRPIEPPELHLGGGVEPGTELPTVYAPDLSQARAALEARHPGFDWAAFEEAARADFLALQHAWSTQRWEDARPRVSDALFNTWRYQLEQYRRAGLRNQVEDAQVRAVTVVKVEHDAVYDAVTLRIEAKMRDWTVNRAGRVVGGSAQEPRLFTEYWTFLRAQDSDGRATPTERCPQCSGPLDRVNEGGVCGYCGAHLTGGALRWVVSGITQDEVYTG